MEIETKHASLDLLAVTIQALHVSGKQMTLAVFRQLPVALAFDNDGGLMPLTHWGLVRYTIKDECGGSALWLVASKDGILYRCDAENPYDSVPHAERLVEEATKALSDHLAWQENQRKYEVAEAEYNVLWREYDAAQKQCPNYQDYKQRDAWIAKHCPQQPIYPQSPQRELHTRNWTMDDFLQQCELSAAHLNIVLRGHDSLRRVHALPQLFIAV